MRVPVAWTRNCRNQAYRLGESAWGLQFHLEADEALIGRWLASESGKAEIDRHCEDARRAEGPLRYRKMYSGVERAIIAYQSRRGG